MAATEDMFYFLNWEFIPPNADLVDATQGNEIIEIYVQDLDGCRPACRYTLPITDAGRSFGLLRANLLYPKDKCTRRLKQIFVSVRVLRGYEQKLIYMNNVTLLPPYYANGSIFRIPIYRIWHFEDYVKLILPSRFL